MTEEHHVWCQLCTPPARFEWPDEFCVHARVEHDIDVIRDVERWPDGEPVIVDLSFSPEDFA